MSGQNPAAIAKLSRNERPVNPTRSNAAGLCQIVVEILSCGIDG
jgi:hypothetical protein